MEIVEDRYAAGSSVITSQLLVDTWPAVIDAPTFADAILDRLIHDGAEWGGRRYRSLSAVARAITGTRRNGPAFFGLREGASR